MQFYSTRNGERPSWIRGDTIISPSFAASSSRLRRFGQLLIPSAGQVCLTHNVFPISSALVFLANEIVLDLFQVSK